MLLGPAPAQECPAQAGLAGSAGRCASPTPVLREGFGGQASGQISSSMRPLLGSSCAGQQRHGHPCQGRQYSPSQGGTGCDPIPLQWEEQKGSQAANATAPVVLGCQLSSARLRHDSGQLVNSSKTGRVAERWQVRSVSLFTLPSWSPATSKTGERCQKNATGI